jgi:hypothetical protein
MPVYKKVNKVFFKIWSPDMAYVLGFLFADGNIIKTSRGGYYVAFHTKDKGLIENIKVVLKSEHKVAYRKTVGVGVYRLQIGSKEWYEDLSNLGLIPNKADRMELPKIPDKYLGHFLRGYFDGDGNVWMGKVKASSGGGSKIVIQTAFTSSSELFLKSLLDSCRAIGVEGGAIHKIKNKNASRLTFSILDSLKLYEIMYNDPCTIFLVRKRVVFDKFINLRA